MQWFYDLKTIHKMCILIGVMALGMLAIAFTGYYFNEKASQDMESLYKDRLLPVKWLNLARVHTNANRANVLNIILDANSAQQHKCLEDINSRMAKVNELLSSYEKTKLDPYEVENLAKLKNAINDYRSTREQIIALSLADKKDAAYAYFRRNAYKFEAIIKYMEGLADYNAKVADNINTQHRKNAQSAITIIITVSLSVLVLCIWLGFVTALRIQSILGKLGERLKKVASGDLNVEKIGRPEKSCIGDLCVDFDGTLVILNKLNDLVKSVSIAVSDVSAGTEEMSAAAEQTAQGSQQVSVSIAQLATGAQEQANNATTSLLNIKSMNDGIQKVYENSENVVKMANSTETSALQGCSQAERAIGKINQIKVTSNKTAETANKLNNLSADISQIIDLIKNIAGQTNLLALNAAIEAARAGEHGKGFAVVADEVKKLASQSANATDKITEMIKEIQKETSSVVVEMNNGVKEIEEGVVIIETVGNALTDILEVAKAVSAQSMEVSSIGNNLTKESDTVVRMMENIAAITEQSAASAQEIASITEEQTASVEEISASSNALAKIAEDLNKQVSIFKI